jgi:hypothetical protein
MRSQSFPPPTRTPAPRLADVVAELEALTRLAAAGAVSDAVEASRRGRSMLERLRQQFLAEVILAPPDTPPVPGVVASEPGAVGQ